MSTVLVRRVLVLVAMAALAVGCTSGPQSTRSATSTSGATSTSEARGLSELVANVTPAGWAPVDVGELQVSVPSDWEVVTQGSQVCGTVPGEVFVGETVHEGMGNGCRPVRDVVEIVQISYLPGAYAAEHPLLVNGVPVFVGPNSVNSLTYFVPSLGEEVTAFGPLAGRVVRTITHSPLSVVLAGGVAPPVPSSWQRVAYRGVTFAVPKSWSVQRSRWPWCTSGVLSKTVVLGTFDSQSSLVVPGCLGPGPAAAYESGRDGVLVAVGRYSPLTRSATGACFHPNGLKACQAGSSGTSIDLVVSPPGRPSVDVEIGIAGNGMIARTILYSLRAG